MMKKQPEMKNKRIKRVSSSPHTTGWLFVLVFIMVVLTLIKGIDWIQEKKLLSEQRQSIDQKIEKEKYRTQQLLEYKEYMKTDEYIEDVAGNDLGMVYDGEVIFKEDN